MPVTLRPATPEDEEFLREVYASTRAEELARVPWTIEQRDAFIGSQFEAQQLHYRTHNPNATHDVIMVDGRPAGRLYVSRREQEIRILDITLLPEERGRGVGAPLINALMEESASAGLPLNIYVESYNPSMRLFERLGFRMVDGDGINQLMEWRASQSAVGEEQ